MPSVLDISDHPRFGLEGSLENLEQYIRQLEQASALQSLEHLGSERKPSGTLHRYGFITESGYAYNGNVTIPDEPTSDIPVIATCAWGTSPSGHNEHTGLKLLEDGLSEIVVGNEGSYRPKKLLVPKQKMTLAGTAAAALTFSREVSREFGYILDPRLRTAIGESKGGMEGMGLLSLAPFFDQEILMADFTAACMPRKIKLEDLVELSTQLRTEPIALIRLGGKLTLGLVMHYPATVDLHPYAVAHQVVKGQAVFSGEAGDLGRLVDKKQLLHMSTFSGDFASMQQVWEEIFADHSNISITPLDGNHLTIADPETLAYIRARQRAFRDVYAAKFGSMEDITGDEVFDLAHTLIDNYLRPDPQGTVNKAVRFIFGHSSSKKAA